MKAIIAAVLAVAAIGASALAQLVHFAPEKILFDAVRPAAGFWMGNLTLPPGPVFIACDIRTDDHGATSARVTLLNLGATETTAEQAVLENRSLDLKLRTAAGALQFTAAISEDGQKMAGPARVTAGGKGFEGTIELGRSLRPSSIPAAMAFRGTMNFPATGDLEMAFVFAPTPGGNWVGHLDVPVQGLRGYPLINTRRDGRRITADFALPGGGAIDVELDEAERAITGRFKQATIEAPINFTRADDYVAPSLHRPQEPTPPLPYETREFAVTHLAGHVIAGTLTLPPPAPPESDNPTATLPVALLITGSGQQDRDETILGHKPFLVIADFLTRSGIAVMRCDDRGTGASTGAETLVAATSRDFAGDALAVINELKTIPRIDARRIGLIGHSEGGIIAPMVVEMAAKEGVEIAFVVMLAGTAVSGREILEMQNRLLFKAQGASEETADLIVQRLAAVLDLVAAGEIEEAPAREAVRLLVEAQVAAAGSPPGNAGDAVIDAAVKWLASPWLKLLITYDPRPALAALKCPVLACNGTLDLQVWHDQNLPVIETAIREAGGDVTIRRYEGLNHLFQPARTGAVAEYAAIDITFDEAVLRDIVEWIKRKAP